MDVTIRPLGETEIERELFRPFTRRQEVNLCLRRDGDRWVVRPDPFIDDWRSMPGWSSAFGIPSARAAGCGARSPAGR